MQRHHLLTGLLLLVLLGSGYGFYSMWTNTLYNNGNWESSKVKLGKGVIGSVAFMVTHRALAGGTLDLSTWLGFQEIFYKKPVSYDELSIDIKLAKGAEVSIFFEKKEDTLAGLFLSNKQRSFIAPLSATDHQFNDRGAGLPQNFDPDEWYRLKADFKSGLKVYLDNKLVFKDSRKISPNLLGLRGNMNSVLVDNIDAEHRGEEVLRETFSAVMSAPIIICGVLVVLVFSLFVFRFPKKYRRPLLWIMLCLAAVSFAFFLYYKFVGQYRYPPEWSIDWKGHRSNIEFAEDVDRRLQKEFSYISGDSVITIMFLGSSQTWGAGASHDSLTFIRKFNNLAYLFCPGKVRCFNVGVSGSRSNELVKVYSEKWIKYRPDILIVNLSNNDRGNDQFGKNLEKLIAINNGLGIKTIFILEPNVEHGYMGLDGAHAIMRWVAEKNKITVVDMQSKIDNYRTTGYLFWDNVHLTDYGQKLFARELLLEILPDVCGEKITK